MQCSTMLNSSEPSAKRRGTGWNLYSILLVLFVNSILSSKSQELSEYCTFDIFNATCSPGHVIVMTAARYGRMRVGRCLKTNYSVGCVSDVLAVVDARCSGNQQCHFKIPDPELARLRPCRADLSLHLEASYICVPVETAPSSRCRGKLPVVTPSGYLSSAVARNTSFGFRACPWYINVAPGQRINVTLIDFTSHTSVSESDDQAAARPDVRQCRIIASLREKDLPTQNVCSKPYMDQSQDSTSSRERHVYRSLTNDLEVMFANQSGANFLLKYEATGCADIEAPPGASVDRQGDTMLLSCNHSGHRWHLVCRDTTWIGTVRNCSTAPQTADNTDKTSSGKKTTTREKNFPFGLLIAIGIGVIIGVVLGFVFLIIVFTFRKRRNTTGRETSLLVEGSTYAVGDNQRNAYKLVEVACQRPVPDLTCDCVHAELMAQTLLADDKSEHASQRADNATLGRGVHCDYERPPKQLTDELLKNALHQCASEDCPHDDWIPHDVYRSHIHSDSYPALFRPLVSFKGDQPNCSTLATGTPHTHHRTPANDQCPDCQPQTTPAGDLQYYSGS